MHGVQDVVQDVVLALEKVVMFSFRGLEIGCCLQLVGLGNFSIVPAVARDL